MHTCGHTWAAGESPGDMTKSRGKGGVMWCDTGLRAEGEKKRKRWRDYDRERKWEEQLLKWQWMFSCQLWAFSSCLHVWITIIVTLPAGESCVQTSIPAPRQCYWKVTERGALRTQWDPYCMCRTTRFDVYLPASSPCKHLMQRLLSMPKRALPPPPPLLKICSE